MLIGPISTGSAVGSSGSATATGTSPTVVRGLIYAAYVQYNDSPPATTDVTIKTLGTSPSMPSRTILTITDGSANGLFMPRVDTCQSNATLNLDYAGLPPVEDYVQVTIAQANANDSVDVWLDIIGQ